jgi:hypothetical protein
MEKIYDDTNKLIDSPILYPKIMKNLEGKIMFTT